MKKSFFATVSFIIVASAPTVSAHPVPSTRINPVSISDHDGIYADGSRCSIGAVGYSRGIKVLFTAGHCVNRPGQTVTKLDTRETIGTVIVQRYTDPENHKGYDYAVVALADNVSISGTVDRMSTQIPYYTCKSGIRSGKTCGTDQGEKNGGESSSMHVDHGDSGSAVVSEDGSIMYGITSLVYTDDDDNVVGSGYQRWGDIRQDMIDRNLPGADFTPARSGRSRSDDSVQVALASVRKAVKSAISALHW